MTRAARLLLVAAAICLGVAQLLPLWQVRLVAPQYPEGLGLLIRVNTVTGIKPNDLQSINGLNHYIGMKVIEPGMIPELRWMPWILAALAVAGLVAAAAGARRGVMAWLAAFLVLERPASGTSIDGNTTTATTSTPRMPSSSCRA